MDACWDVWDIISCWVQLTWWALQQEWDLLQSPIVFSRAQQVIFTAYLAVLEVWLFTYRYFKVMSFSFTLIVLIRSLVFVLKVFFFAECATTWLAFLLSIVFWIIMKSTHLCIFCLFGEAIVWLMNLHRALRSAWKRHSMIFWVCKNDGMIFSEYVTFMFNLYL